MLKNILNKNLFSKNLIKFISFNNPNSFINKLSLLIITTLSFCLITWIFSTQEWIYLPGRNTQLRMVELYNPGKDGGYLEYFQYILLLWCALISFFIAKKQGLRNIWFLPITYFFLFLDDYLLIHDKIITFSINLLKYLDFIQTTNIYIGDIRLLRYKDIGEIIYWLIVFSLFIIAFDNAFKKGTKGCKSYITSNLIFFICLAFFAIFVDLFNSNLPMIFEGSKLYFPVKNSLVFLEEFGEISTIAYAFLWNFNFLETRS